MLIPCNSSWTVQQQPGRLLSSLGAESPCQQVDSSSLSIALDSLLSLCVPCPVVTHA